jgi:hypothetical protein
MLALVTGICLLISYCVHLVFEKPILVLRDRIT